PVTDVAHREDAGHAGLERVRRAVLEPLRTATDAAHDVPARPDEPLLVTLHDVLEPGRVRAGPDQDEQRAGGDPFGLAARRLLDRQRLEPRRALGANHLG